MSTTPEIEARILAFMRKHNCYRGHATTLSMLGQAAFPERGNRSAQGYALAVSRIVRSMQDRGLLRPSLTGPGYYLAELPPNRQQKGTT